jgi:hypothetical protein
VLLDSARKLWVIEVNTRPGIDADSSREAYRYAFGRLTGDARPIERATQQATREMEARERAEAERRRREADERERHQQELERQRTERIRHIGDLLINVREHLGEVTIDELDRIEAFARRYPFNARG